MIHLSQCCPIQRFSDINVPYMHYLLAIGSCWAFEMRLQLRDWIFNFVYFSFSFKSSYTVRGYHIRQYRSQPIVVVIMSCSLSATGLGKAIWSYPKGKLLAVFLVRGNPSTSWSVIFGSDPFGDPSLLPYPWGIRKVWRDFAELGASHVLAMSPSALPFPATWPWGIPHVQAQYSFFLLRYKQLQTHLALVHAYWPAGPACRAAGCRIAATEECHWLLPTGWLTPHAMSSAKDVPLWAWDSAFFGACWSLGRGAGTTHKIKVERPLARQPSKHSDGEINGSW